MKLSLALYCGALLFAGCTQSSAPSGPSAPAAPVSPPAATNMPAASPKMDMPVMTGTMPDKDCSHVLTQDEPAFATMPGAQGVAPIGMIKAGTKVLSLVPMTMYTKCDVGGGKTVWVKTSSLKPTTN